ncbi:hypothetical protein BOX15_Mlig000712g1, partial [Macrostomum lignano]
RKFDDKENISSVNNAKNSVQKGIRNTILTQYPGCADYVDQILPKKETLSVVKCHEHIELYANPAGEVLFFRQRDSPLYPSLKLLHRYPFMLPHMQADKGAIKFLLNGSNVMCPGLTTPGGRLSQVPASTVVAVMAEGKQHALAIGLTAMSADEIASKNKGVGIETVHCLNDGLWRLRSVK